VLVDETTKQPANTPNRKHQSTGQEMGSQAEEGIDD